MRKQPIITLTDEIVPPLALVRAGLDALPAIIRAQGERASRRFIEFFTANIRNRNTRAAPLDAKRAGKGRAVTVTVKLEPALYRKLKLYGVDRRETNQDILVEALSRLLGNK